MLSAIESAYLVGSVVIDDVVKHWNKRKTQLPTPSQ